MAPLRHHDGLDTALARLLHDQGAVEYQSLKFCLGEVRRRRDQEPAITLAKLLLQRNLVSAEGVNDGLAQLAPDDYLVHSDHGIGTYRGLVELAAGQITSELLCIEYLAGDRLFLPVHRLNLVQRFGGADGVKPRIDQVPQFGI